MKSKKLSRDEMKTVFGGSNKTIWSCNDGFGYYTNVCSLTNPSDPSNHCSGLTCTNTGVNCGSAFQCP